MSTPNGNSWIRTRCTLESTTVMHLLDALHRLLGRHIEVHNQIRALHKVRHILRQCAVRVKVALLEQALLHQHLGKDHVLVDRAVLHTAAALPNDDLLLFEAQVEQVHLQRKAVLLHVLVKIGEVLVRHDWLKIRRQVQHLAERSRQRRLASANQARDADEDLF